MTKWGNRYNYKGYNDCDCHCYLMVAGSAVLCTQTHDNHGTSITNMAETLATRVCREWNIPFASLVWIEHYERDEYDKRNGLKETFDLVEFGVVNRANPYGRMTGEQLINPRRKPADMDYVRGTFGV